MHNWADIIDQIAAASGINCGARSITPIGGGCSHSAFLLTGGVHPVFVKIAQHHLIESLQSEASGLMQLRQTNTIRVPDLYCTGISGDHSFIAMQGIEFGAAKAHSYTLLGEQLAALHQHQSPTFGTTHDNYIGTTPQINTRSNNWFSFWRKHRLGYQLQLAKQNGASLSLIDDGYRLGASMEALFATSPVASCLHGDLWQGNWGFDKQGQPLIFDPAHYYGDRETDIAMTHLFGTAQSAFYTAYQHHYPMSGNYRQRQIFYNIYHILNHYNLFGGRYLDQAQIMIQKLLADLG